MQKDFTGALYLRYFMSTLDYILIGIILISVIKGAFQGLIRQLFSVAGLLAGLLLAGKYCAAVGNFSAKFGLDASIGSVIAFIAIFAAVTIAAKIIGYVLHRAGEKLFLGWLNHLLGAVFGLVEGVLIIAVTAALLNFLPPRSQLGKLKSNSIVMQTIDKAVSPLLYNFHRDKPKVPKGTI